MLKYLILVEDLKREEEGENKWILMVEGERKKVGINGGRRGEKEQLK